MGEYVVGPTQTDSDDDEIEEEQLLERIDDEFVSNGTIHMLTHSTERGVRFAV